MLTLLPGIIMGFREGLEAFLVVGVIIHYLDKVNLNKLKSCVSYGASAGIAISVFVGWLIHLAGTYLGNISVLAKMWESMASLAALSLITTFIVWMINHGRNMIGHVQEQVSSNLSKMGIFLISTTVIAREGVEIAIFAYAGKYTFISIFIGIMAALLLAILVVRSLVKIDIGLIFRVTIVYLILQAGYLLGYGIHEGLSAMKDMGYLGKNSALLTRVFDVSSGMFDHKTGSIGLLLNVFFGWYSRPEWLQFIAQYGYSFALLALMQKRWSKSTQVTVA